MGRQVIEIGPRGGRIVGHHVEHGKQVSDYEGNAGGNVGLARRPALERPVQGDLFAGQPRTLVLTSPEATRARRPGPDDQGDLFGGPPRTLALAGAGRAAPARPAAEAPKPEEQKPFRPSVGDVLMVREKQWTPRGEAQRYRTARATLLSADDTGTVRVRFEGGTERAYLGKDAPEMTPTGERDEKAVAADRADNARKNAVMAAREKKKDAEVARLTRMEEQARGVRRRITEDDASLYGSQYLGHEGEMHTFRGEGRPAEPQPKPTLAPAAKFEAQAAERKPEAPAAAHRGREDYQERREARIDRLHARAESKAGEAESRMAAFHGIHEHIPMGQPILVGHHSEGRHRRDLERASAHADAALKAQTEARKLEERARAAEKNQAVSSDDPEAVRKLKEQIAAAEKTQETYRALNKIVKAKGLTDDEKVSRLVSEHGVKEATARRFLQPDELGRTGVPDYQLTNNSANIRRMKQRVEQLGAVAAKPASETSYGDVRVHDNADANRVQLFFPGKPDDATRAELKAHGFRWAPSEGAWQRHRSEGALYHAKRLAEKFGGKE